MGCTVSYNVDLKIIEICFVGAIDGDDLVSARKVWGPLSREKKCKYFLLDATEQTVAPDILDLYNSPDQYEDEGLDQQSRAALVMSEDREVQEASYFWETVCQNRGWYVKLFHDRDDAIQWLKDFQLSNES